MEYCRQIYFKTSHSLYKVTPINTKFTIISKIWSVLSEVLWARNFVFRQQWWAKAWEEVISTHKDGPTGISPEYPFSHCQIWSKRQARSVATSSSSFKSSNFLSKTPRPLTLESVSYPTYICSSDPDIPLSALAWKLFQVLFHSQILNPWQTDNIFIICNISSSKSSCVRSIK